MFSHCYHLHNLLTHIKYNKSIVLIISINFHVERIDKSNLILKLEFIFNRVFKVKLYATKNSKKCSKLTYIWRKYPYDYFFHLSLFSPSCSLTLSFLPTSLVFNLQKQCQCHHKTWYYPLLAHKHESELHKIAFEVYKVEIIVFGSLNLLELTPWCWDLCPKSYNL